MARPLTMAQQKILGYIRGFVAEHAYPPTMAEIAAAVYMSKSGVKYQLGRLVEKGWLERQPMIARGLRLVDREVADG